MPTYLYKDLDTGEIYEIRQSMRDEALTHHPESGVAIRRVPARPAIAFKGSGFYANDSRPKSSSGEGGSGSAKSSEGAASGTASSDKPAASPAPSAPSPSKAGE